MSLYSSQTDYLESGAIVECLERYFGAQCTEMLMREVKLKMNDLNPAELDSAMRMIAGTARSMGLEVAD